MSDIVNVEKLSLHTGIAQDRLRAAGSILFSQLRSEHSDLTKALIAASRQSDLPPEKVFAILGAIATGFDEVNGPGTSGGTSAPFVRIPTFASKAAGGLIKDIWSRIEGFDFETVRSRGVCMLARAREQAAGIDLGGLRQHGSDIGKSLAERAQGLVRRKNLESTSATPQRGKLDG